MSAVLAQATAPVIAALLAGWALILALGYALAHRGGTNAARSLAWVLTAAATLYAERLTAGSPPALRMTGIIVLLLAGMKAVAGAQPASPPLPPGRWLAFAAAWLGMRPEVFAAGRERPRSGVPELARRGLVNIAAGAALIAAAFAANGAHAPLLLTTALLLAGSSLVVHFGILHLLAALWRRRGVPANPLFRAPFASRTLGEFWSRRWNVGFSEMLALTVNRPIARRAGATAGLAASFALSGLLHEAAISLPVRAGYGLPFLYFALHGALTKLEAAWLPLRRALARHAWLGRSWVALTVLAPLPLLAHAPFLRGVVWPLFGS